MNWTAATTPRSSPAAAKSTPEGVKVYNLEVEGDHTYFVAIDAGLGGGTTADAVWVHNWCKVPASLLRNSKGWILAKNYEVYIGLTTKGRLAYVGVTNNLSRRVAEHGDLFRIPGALLSGLTKRQARAIEQALIEKYGLRSAGGILQNRINSIAAGRSWYQEAVKWGRSIVSAKGW